MQKSPLRLRAIWPTVVGDILPRKDCFVFSYVHDPCFHLIVRNIKEQPDICTDSPSVVRDFFSEIGYSPKIKLHAISYFVRKELNGFKSACSSHFIMCKM